MSGIVGILYLDDRPAHPAVVDRMAATITHRGPDAAGLWIDGPVGLGHRMLRTTAESLTETMPLKDPVADLVLTADARIDNREELLEELGLSCRTQVTDGEIILAAYRQWGESCPERLVGDFAFAIWDSRERLLFCARDHFGVRPLFYHWSPGRFFVFGSEMKAIFSVAGVPRRINEAKVADFLSGPIDEVDTTLFQDVGRLVPGHSLSVGPGGLRHRRYYTLDPSRELRLRSDGEYDEAFREVFTEAVRCRLRSAVPVGSLLSGGLDSSSVTCVARDLLAKTGQTPLTTYSAVFDEVSRCDERAFIEPVLARGGFEPHFVHADRLSALADVESICRHHDEAVWGGTLFVTWGLLSAAKEQGTRVVLDGHDGDGVVSHAEGYIPELAHQGRWLSLAREMKAYGDLQGQPYKHVIWRYVRRYGLAPLAARTHVSGAVWRVRRLRQAAARLVGVGRSSATTASSGQEGPPWQAHFNPEFAERLGLARRYQRLAEFLPFEARTEREGHYRILSQPLRTLSLEELDRDASAFSLELRHPFFDKRVVEFCLSLPADQKRRHGRDRFIARRALGGVLPEEVRWRARKAEFSPALSHVLFNVDRDRFRDLLAENSEMEHRYLDMGAVRGTYDRLVSLGTGEASWELSGLWKAMRLALWLRLCQPDPPTAGGDARRPAA